MEALCAGLPVVMSDVGGAREQVGLDGERGYIVPNLSVIPIWFAGKALAEHDFSPSTIKMLSFTPWVRS